MTPFRLDLEIPQGTTYRRTFRRGTSTRVYKSIAAVPIRAPCTLTVNAHGMVNGWPFRVESAKGMTDLNCDPDQWYIAKVIDPNTIEINALNATDFDSYTGSGVIIYHEPEDLSVYSSARAHFREAKDSAATLFELTTAGGALGIDNAAKTITMEIDDALTSPLSISRGVWDLELVDTSGEPYRAFEGAFRLTREITR